MPVNPSTAYNTFAQILTLIQALLNDAAGNYFTSTVILPYANSAYRKVQRALENVSAASFITDDVLVVVSAVAQTDPSAQVSITDATASPNQLPPDLLVPMKLWERANNSGDDFVEMTDMTDRGGLPSEPQGQMLRFWEWRTDGLYFIGATQDMQIRLRYRKAYPDLSDGTSAILIRNAQEPIAYLAAAMAGAARGSPLAEKYDAAGMDALEDLVNRAVQQMQRGARRRRPYSSRAGFSPRI